jgi:hypothetical protein
MNLLIMSKIKFVVLILLGTLILISCQTVSEKIDAKTTLEEKELSKWLNKRENELKIEYGQPDEVEFLKTRNRNYIYISEKLKIKCERKFEINPNNVVIGFSSKNCF